MKKRKLTGAFVVTEFEGSEMTVYGRVDEFETEELFMEAAQNAANKKAYDDGDYGSIETSSPRQCWLRTIVCDPATTEEFGSTYFITEVGGPGRGNWKSWAAEAHFQHHRRGGR